MLSDSSTLIIALDHLVKSFASANAVNGISFSVAKGEVVGLLGGNGAGKTTTIGMIMGLVTPSSGSVQVFGVNMVDRRYEVLHRMNFESFRSSSGAELHSADRPY